MKIIVFATLALLIGALVSGRVRPVLAFTGALGVFVALDLIELESALANVVNPSLVTLVLLILVSLALQKTPLVSGLGNRLLRGGYSRGVCQLFGVVCTASAVVNNTAVVASLISTVSRNRQFLASRVLLPLSYASIFGGGLTLIGSSTNMIVNSLAIQGGYGALGFFTITPLGLVMAGVGCLMTVLLGYRFLPKRQIETRVQQNYFVEARVGEDSPLIGKSIEENGLRHLGRLFLVEVVRNGKLISPVAPGEKLLAGDALLFSGDASAVSLLQKFPGLKLFRGTHDAESSPLLNNLAEAYISQQSVLVGKTVRDINFRSQFGAAVVAIRRGSERLEGPLSNIILRTGDSLVLAVGEDFSRHTNLERNFYLINGIEAEPALSPIHSVLVLASFLLTLGLSVIGLLPLMEGLAFLLGGLVITKVLTLAEIRRRFPFEMLVIVAATLGIAQVLLTTGVAGSAASGVNAVFGQWGVYGALVGVYFLALLFTEVINNNAAAALVFPIAMEMANRWEAEPLPFIIALIFGASASFISPFGYQTNLMVFSAGNYRVQDFIRVGLPLSVVYSVVVLALIPLFFPF
ncbi:SLC13 family permease [Endozoicomonas sp. Mp262]|uniref:SLC13 family permease n=1 Tax=Endozoicomonas sp. Mp262 TaxID=2919499 RepID=UPI0021D7DD22